MGNYFTTNNSNKTKLYHLALFKWDNHYTIHGLWVDYSDGTYPSFCKDIEFDIKQLDPIKEKLMKYWELPKDHDKLEEHLYKHEYRKHGSCMFTHMTELEYFSKAIELYEKYVLSGKLDISRYNQGGKYMIPFDLEFNLIEK
jgi:ribonuclease I